MVRAVAIEGSGVEVTIALTVPGCPMKANLEQQVQQHVGAVDGVESVAVAFDVMTPEQRTALRQRLSGAPAGEERKLSLEPVDACDRRGLRQGRCRQVVADRQPGGGAGAGRGRGGRRRRRHLRLLDAAHAGHLAAAGGGRPDDDPARQPRPQDHVDRVLRGRRRRDPVARPDAAPRARAVPVRCPLGRARLPGGGHASRHRRHLDLAGAAAARARSADRDDARRRRLRRWRAGPRTWRRRRACGWPA